MTRALIRYAGYDKHAHVPVRQAWKENALRRQIKNRQRKAMTLREIAEDLKQPLEDIHGVIFMELGRIK